jgi:hypothetical protein
VRPTQARTCAETGGGRSAVNLRAATGLLALAAVLAMVLAMAPAASAQSSLDVFVGYADSERGTAGNFPTPWYDASNPQIIFEGCHPTASCKYDGGAIRLVNNSSSSVTVNSVKVSYTSACVYDIWPHDVTLPAGKQMILTETQTITDTTPGGCTASLQPGQPGYGVMDGSDIGPNGSDYDHHCTLDGIVPQVAVTVNGASTATTFTDTGQVLNTLGWDSAYCPSPGANGAAKNESIQWTAIGAVPCLGSAITLGPPSQSDVRGGLASVTAHLADGCGHPLQGASVSYRVFGGNAPNAGLTGSGATDAQGDAAWTYPDVNSALGTDQVQATVKNPSGTLTSNAVNVTWASTPSQGSGGPSGTGSGPLAVIARLSLRPSSFVAARSGPSALTASGRQRFGAVVSYHDSQPAVTSFAVIQLVPGQRRGRACVRLGRGRRHGQACTRSVSLGVFTRGDVTGANRFRFTGRMRGRRLAAGRYILEVIPHTSAGAGRMRTASFRIKQG